MPEPDPTPDLPIVGVEPVFRHLDDPDLTWQQCRRQRNADGSESSVWEKWLAFSPEPQYLSLYARYDPGMIVRRHGHYSPHLRVRARGRAVGRPAPLPAPAPTSSCPSAPPSGRSAPATRAPSCSR